MVTRYQLYSPYTLSSPRNPNRIPILPLALLCLLSGQFQTFINLNCSRGAQEPDIQELVENTYWAGFSTLLKMTSGRAFQRYIWNIFRTSVILHRRRHHRRTWHRTDRNRRSSIGKRTINIWRRPCLPGGGGYRYTCATVEGSLELVATHVSSLRCV